MTVYIFKGDYSVRSPIFDFVEDEGRKEFQDVFYKRKKFTIYNLKKLFVKQIDKKKLFDVFNIIGHVCISQKVKNIIEEYERGIHIFYPISLLNEAGVEYAERYFILLTEVYIICEMASTPENRWGVSVGGRPHADSNYASRPEVAGRHLWRSFMAYHEPLHISGTLHDRFEKEKIRYTSYRGIGEVDEQWIAEAQMMPLIRWVEEDPARVADYAHRYPQWVRQHRPQWLKQG